MHHKLVRKTHPTPATFIRAWESSNLKAYPARAGMTTKITFVETIKKMPAKKFISLAPKYLLSPFTVSLFVTIMLFCFGGLLYETNDDMAMIGILTGNYWTVSSPYTIFMSLPLSLLFFNLIQNRSRYSLVQSNSLWNNFRGLLHRQQSYFLN